MAKDSPDRFYVDIHFRLDALNLRYTSLLRFSVSGGASGNPIHQMDRKGSIIPLGDSCGCTRDSQWTYHARVCAKCKVCRSAGEPQARSPIPCLRSDSLYE